MKKILVLFCFVATVQVSLAQKANGIRDSLYQLLSQTQDPSEQINLLGLIADEYRYSGQTDRSRKIAEQILKIASNSHQDILLARAYIIIGSDFNATSEFKQSIEFQLKGAALAERSKSASDLWRVYKELGINFKLLKNYNEALRYLRKSARYLNAVDANSSNRTYSHMAEVFLGLRQPDSALRYVQLANEVTIKEKDAFGYARVLYIFATVYNAASEIDLAESYYKKCIAYSDSEDIYLPYVTAAVGYGQYLFDTKQYDLSKYYALNSFHIASEAKDKLWMINAAGLLRKAYYFLGQKDSSYYYSSIKDAYSDSVFNEQQQNQIQNLAFSYKIREKEDAARLSLAEQRYKENIQYALIATGIIFLLTLYLLLSRSFITNTKLIEFFGVVALLIAFEFLNLLLHPFLERITNHSPLLMLIGLVCIAALLVPLHHKIEKLATAKLVEKNKQIRLAEAKKTIEQLESQSDDKSL